MLRFGTDGVRGDADTDLTDEFVTKLGRAAARVLGTSFVVGRDTRESGRRIELAFVAGVALEGGTVEVLDVFPTPGIAYVGQHRNVPAAVISASHNPWHDNGIKLLAAGGTKLPDEIEAAIEREVDALDDRAGSSPELRAVDASREYIAHLVAALDGRTLDGMKVVLDGANGAACEVAPAALRQLGADVVAINIAPNGRNINDSCGSTHPQALQAAVVEQGAQLGLALDGDADRVLAVDERGALVDGDQLMTAFALDLHARGVLRNGKIAVTVMSNLGLREALAANGIGIVETPVGDRNVLVALAEHDLVLGGEQSGHIIRTDLATTGDGTLTGVLLADLVRRSGRSLSALGAQMTRYPQLLVNVRVARRPDLGAADGLWAEVRAVEAELGEHGRVLVRASGTEPLVRVMVEAPTEGAAHQAAERLRTAVEQAFSAD